MKIAIPFLLLSVLVVGCSHYSKPRQTKFTYPWQRVGDGVSDLVAQHAELSAFNQFKEVSHPPKRLYSFAEIEKLTSGRKWSAAVRAEQLRWFHSASSVWSYTFECQFSGILFVDDSGRVQHAILQG